jgi:ubiquinone biosynthesis protein
MEQQASTLDKLRENLRLQQVYNVFLRYGLDIAFERVPTIAVLRASMQRWVWNLPEDLESPELPVKVRLMIEELGPTYVKVGQIVSSQASVLPAEWEEQLAKLQSNVPPFPGSQVREIIVDELGKSPEELYATFEPTPLAAASTAQVHRATLHDGTEVVVKVQRPHIRNQMKADVGIMRNAARVLSNRSQALQAIDLAGMVNEFGANAIRELDYTGEAYNSFRLTQNMATVPGVHIPKIYSELSTDRVLTMEFIRGVKISNLEAIDAAGLDRAALARNALRAIVKQLLIDGFFHADPHPGNVLVDLHTGDIAFIDTGMVGELELAQRLNIIQLLLAVTQNDVTGMASVMKSLSTPFVDKVDEKAYYKDFERTIGRIMISGDTVDFGQAVSLAMDLLRQHGLRLDANLTLAIKALMQAQAIALLLYPRWRHRGRRGADDPRGGAQGCHRRPALRGGQEAAHDDSERGGRQSAQPLRGHHGLAEAVPQGAFRGLCGHLRPGQGGQQDQSLWPAGGDRRHPGRHVDWLGHRHGGHWLGPVPGPVLEHHQPIGGVRLHLLVGHRRGGGAAAGLALAAGQPGRKGLNAICLHPPWQTHCRPSRLHRNITSAPCQVGRERLFCPKPER